MHDISQISYSPSLEELYFGDRVWTKYILNTLDPLIKCNSLKNLSFSAKKIIDRKIEPIAYLDKLEELTFPTNLFTTEQVAWLKAHLPTKINSKILMAYRTIDKPIQINGKNKDTFIVGKRKPFLDSIQDKNKVEMYVGQFNEMHKWFLDNLEASPEDYN
jgi:hypothetical protein